MKNVNSLTNEKIISMVKSQAPFGGFAVGHRYKDYALKERMKNFTNKSKQLIPIYYPSGVVYFYNPFYEICLELNSLTYKKVCKRFTNKFPNHKEWTLENLQAIIDKTEKVVQ